MIVIIHHTDGELDDTIYGPFYSSDEAMRWACNRFGIGGPWYWLPVKPPTD